MVWQPEVASLKPAEVNFIVDFNNVGLSHEIFCSCYTEDDSEMIFPGTNNRCTAYSLGIQLIFPRAKFQRLDYIPLARKESKEKTSRKPQTGVILFISEPKTSSIICDHDYDKHEVSL